ncbi:hypothetical protein Hanom_Chr04g00353211 [Helianthus anomalus]
MSFKIAQQRSIYNRVARQIQGTNAYQQSIQQPTLFIASITIIISVIFTIVIVAIIVTISTIITSRLFVGQLDSNWWIEDCFKALAPVIFFQGINNQIHDWQGKVVI